MEQQRTKEWFAKRKGRITASNVGAILGLNPWSDRHDVMRQMVRDALGLESEFKGNVATEYGTFHEENAIADFELMHGFEVTETGFHIHPEHDWLDASPDGLIGDDAILEVKCPYGLRNGGEFKSAQDQQHYMAKMQIEMYCTGREKAYFYQWSPQGDCLEIIYKSDWWLNKNLPTLKAFYDEFKKELESPEQYCLPPIPKVERKELVNAYEMAKAALDEAKNALEEAKQNLIDVAEQNGGKCRIGDILVQQVELKGSVSYAKAIKDLLPDADLSKYQGKPTKYWMIK